MLLFVGSLRPGAACWCTQPPPVGWALPPSRLVARMAVSSSGPPRNQSMTSCASRAVSTLSYENYAHEVRPSSAIAASMSSWIPSVGHRGEWAITCFAPAGRLVCYGFSANNTGTSRNLLNVAWQVMRMPFFNAISLMNENRTVTGVNMGHLFAHVDIVRSQLIALLKMYEGRPD